MLDERALKGDKHLRLTVQIENGEATVLDVDVIDEPLVTPGRVAGPFVAGVVFAGGMPWIETMQDPFVRRGVPRAGEHEHHYETRDSATVVVRAPLPCDAVPDDYRVEFYRALGPLPEKLRDLEKLVRLPKAGGLERVSAIGLVALRKHPAWEQAMKRAGLKPHGQ